MPISSAYLIFSIKILFPMSAALYQWPKLGVYMAAAEQRLSDICSRNSAEMVFSRFMLLNWKESHLRKESLLKDNSKEMNKD